MGNYKDTWWSLYIIDAIFQVCRPHGSLGHLIDEKEKKRNG